MGHSTSGNLVISDLWLSEMPSDKEIEEITEKALAYAKIKVVDKLIHKFDPQGSTMVWILSESHCSIHTYPEHKYLSVDIYTCGEEGSAHKAMCYLQDNLDVSFSNIGCYSRGDKSGFHRS